MAHIAFDFDTTIMEVPDAAFAVPATPTTAEVTAWALANKVKYQSHVWKVGTVDTPTNIWLIGRSPTYQATVIQGTPAAS